MRGYYVPRKAGWDCHGLPVELAVEKELGFTVKRDIEEYGIAKFNERCRESVLGHVGKFAELTDRMGYWVDMDDAYWTMDADYVQSVWWSLKQIYDAGLLGEDHRVSPYCPVRNWSVRSRTGKGYEDITDPSVYVRFPLTGGELADLYPGLSLLVWTTTPWTLVSNTAVAAKPDAIYNVVESDGAFYIVAAELVAQVFDEDATVHASLPGTDLERLPYSRPFDLVEIPDAHFVTLGEYVTTEDGTGLVHLAPAFGADDLFVCREYGLPSSIRSGQTEPLSRRSTSWRPVLQSCRRGTRRRPGRPRAAVPAPRLHPPLSTLLALPHAAAVLRATVVVHPHHQDQDRLLAANGELRGTRDNPVGPLWRLATQQRRLGAVAEPVLGNAAADLAMRIRPTTCIGSLAEARRAIGSRRFRA